MTTKASGVTPSPQTEEKRTRKESDGSGGSDRGHTGVGHLEAHLRELEREIKRLKNAAETAETRTTKESAEMATEANGDIENEIMRYYEEKIEVLLEEGGEWEDLTVIIANEWKKEIYKRTKKNRDRRVQGGRMGYRIPNGPKPKKKELKRGLRLLNYLKRARINSKEEEAFQILKCTKSAADSKGRAKPALITGTGDTIPREKIWKMLEFNTRKEETQWVLYGKPKKEGLEY
ncbi:hypothetical protein JTB14_025819 [Gonioctena quinquepunctata]|nr:hypothetical protein JTB14_025819 [Gonioctena quinquepunctata]